MFDNKKLMLVLLAGQSNMAGRGEIEPEDREEIPGLLMINRNFEWVPAVEPVTADRPFAGVGPGRTFGRLLLEANPGCMVGLVPTAVGGTPIRVTDAEEYMRGRVLDEKLVEEITPMVAETIHNNCRPANRLYKTEAARGLTADTFAKLMSRL